MGKLPKKIYLYITKIFLKNFTIVTAAIFLLILIINLFDILDRANKISKLKDIQNAISLSQSVQMAALQVPAFLEDISIFLVMLSAMITLINLSSKSEITIMRSSGLSLWKILSPLIITAFSLGIIFILIFNPLTIFFTKKFHKMEMQLIKMEKTESLSPKNGIWLRQENLENTKQEMIIRAKKVYKNSLTFNQVTIWFFDKNKQYYKKIDAQNMSLIDGRYWQLDEIIINDKNNLNKKAKNFQIPTNLKHDFITQKIITNFENVKLFSIFNLPKLINDLESSGFSPRKFKVYYYSLLTKPFLFISMILIAAFFSINNIRNRNNILYIVAGILTGLILYITPAIISAFGSSGLIPPFAATWIVTTLFLASTILLVFKKDGM